MKSLELHTDFRLWLTSEVHPRFPTILLQSSFKVTYEVSECTHLHWQSAQLNYVIFQSPPGVKKNLQRTYESWSSEYIGQGNSLRAQALFSLAWLHAIVQERRNYIPQVLSYFLCIICKLYFSVGIYICTYMHIHICVYVAIFNALYMYYGLHSYLHIHAYV